MGEIILDSSVSVNKILLKRRMRHRVVPKLSPRGFLYLEGVILPDILRNEKCFSNFYCKIIITLVGSGVIQNVCDVVCERKRALVSL